MSGRVNPTIFDKLAASQGKILNSANRPPAPSDEPTLDSNRAEQPITEGFSEGILRVNLDRYTENSLKASVRRELAWLLNTTNLESSSDLSASPRVKTSVLNYGVADLAGKAQSRLAILGRAVHIKEAVTAFEPRLDAKKLSVEARSTSERENAVTYVIAGDITSAVEALRVQYLTDVETDTGAADVRE
jgi:type VI secretion system protein ImpF